MEIIAYVTGVAVVVIVIRRELIILKQNFIISYCEEKLKNRGVNIDHVKNMSIKDVLFS